MAAALVGACSRDDDDAPTAADGTRPEATTRETPAGGPETPFRFVVAKQAGDTTRYLLVPGEDRPGPVIAELADGGLAAVSTDGRRLALTQPGDAVTPPRLRIYDVLEAPSPALVDMQLDGPAAEPPVFNPAGDAVAVIIEGNRAVGVELPQGRATTVAIPENRSDPPLEWLADGSGFVVCGPTVTAYSRPGLTSATIGERAGNCRTRFRLTPEGASVVRLDPDAGGAGVDAVEVIDATGRVRPAQPLDPPANLDFRDCPIAEDMGLVAFGAERQGREFGSLFLDPASGAWSEEQALPPCNAVRSADGTRWAAATPEGVQAGEVSAGQAAARRLGAQAVSVGRLTFTPDGADVVFSTGGELFVAPFDGHDTGRRLGETPRGAGVVETLCPPTTRAGGMTVASLEGGTLMLVSGDGTLRPLTLPVPASAAVWAPDFSDCRIVDDGRYAQLSSSQPLGERRNVTFVDLGTGEATPPVIDVLAVVKVG